MAEMSYEELTLNLTSERAEIISASIKPTEDFETLEHYKRITLFQIFKVFYSKFNA